MWARAAPRHDPASTAQTCFSQPLDRRSVHKHSRVRVKPFCSTSQPSRRRTNVTCCRGCLSRPPLPLSDVQQQIACCLGGLHGSQSLVPAPATLLWRCRQPPPAAAAWCLARTATGRQRWDSARCLARVLQFFCSCRLLQTTICRLRCCRRCKRWWRLAPGSTRRAPPCSAPTLPSRRRPAPMPWCSANPAGCGAPRWGRTRWVRRGW